MPYADPDRSREAAKMRGRKYRERHPTASRDAQRKRRAKRPEECVAIEKDRRYRREYGLSLAEYEAMAVAQDGKCASCGGPPTKDWALAVDHDHETGEIRGLLCHNCNLGIGNFTEEPWKFRAALRYLAKHKKETKVMTTEKKGTGVS